MLAICLGALFPLAQGADIRLRLDLLDLCLALSREPLYLGLSFRLQTPRLRSGLGVDALYLRLGARLDKLGLAHALRCQHAIHNLLDIAWKHYILHISPQNGHTIPSSSLHHI